MTTNPIESSHGEPPNVIFRLCPKCFRAVPASSGERYCLNDGQRLLEACPQCGTRITSPYARHCGHCGTRFQNVKLKLASET
jgi:endogenous inhibitor of DNA gyrase (YacG/DUF329 family)